MKSNWWGMFLGALGAALYFVAVGEVNVATWAWVLFTFVLCTWLEIRASKG